MAGHCGHKPPGGQPGASHGRVNARRFFAGPFSLMKAELWTPLAVHGESGGDIGGGWRLGGGGVTGFKTQWFRHDVCAGVRLHVDPCRSRRTHGSM